MRRALHVLACLALAALGLMGCARVDAEQIRICRIALPALHPAGAEIVITGIETGSEPFSVVIRHEARAAPNPPRERMAECRFRGGFLSKDRLEIGMLLLDGRPIAEANLIFLRRFWIEDPATASLLPSSPAAAGGHVPELPRTAALVLQHAILALPPIAVYALLAPAYALIYGLIGRINLAFGELAVIGGQGALLGAVAGGLIGEGAPGAILLGSLVFALAAAATHADAVGRHVVEPLARSGGQPMLVATAGLSAALMEYVRLSQGDGVRWTPPQLGTPMVLARSGDFAVVAPTGALVLASLTLASALALLCWMRWSRFGREWRATADEPVAAALMGVDTRAVLVRAMAAAGLLAGLAGFIVTAHYGGMGFAGGLGLGLKALIAAILGGIGSVAGAMLGAVLLGFFEAAWASALPIHLREGAVFMLLVLLLIFRPGGLLGLGVRDPRRDADLR